MTDRDASTEILDGTPSKAPREQRTVRSTYQRLRMAGLSAAEAGNLTAHLNGLHVADHGWTLQEIERLLFIRALVDLGRIPS
jgi:hypothetical protein